MRGEDAARRRRGKGEEDSERERRRLRRDVNLVIQSDLFDNVVYGTAAEREMEWMSELAHMSEWVGVEITAILSDPRWAWRLRLSSILYT